MSDTLGESFTQSGRRATLRAAATTSVAIRGSLPNCNPPQATLGQEIFEFVGGKAIGAFKMTYHFGILLDRMAKNVGNDLSAVRTKGGKFFSNELAHANVLQTHGVQHSCGRADQAWGGSAEHRFE